MLGGVSVAHTAESAFRERIGGRWELIRGGVQRMSPVGALHGMMVLAVGERIRSFSFDHDFRHCGFRMVP